MASTYRAALCVSCAALLASDHSASLSHQRFQAHHLSKSLSIGFHPLHSRKAQSSTGPFRPVGQKRRGKKLGSISGKFRCSLANGPEVVTACSWNERVLSSDVPVLVEFWASWCGPCKMVSRLTDELSQEYSGRIQCFRIDADDYPQVADSLGVERIPTILVFKNAEKVQAITGTLPKSVYVAAIQKALSE